MKTMFARLTLAGLIGLSGLGALAAPAYADSLTLGVYAGDGMEIGYRDTDDGRDDDDGRVNDRGDGERHDWRGRGDDRGDWRGRHHGWNRPERGCAPWLAVNRAQDYGLHRAVVVDITPRRVVVEGRSRGDYRQITFANVRGCPAIR